MSDKKPPLQKVGWREMVSLPDLTDVRIPAKIDTGARTSSLHAVAIERFDKDGQRWIRFLLDLGHHRVQPVTVEAPHADKRLVTSSNGEGEERYIIKAWTRIGDTRFPAEFSLTDRSDMKFPILIGRTALRRRFLVDSSRSYLQSSAEERKRLLKT